MLGLGLANPGCRGAGVLGLAQLGRPQVHSTAWARPGWCVGVWVWVWGWVAGPFARPLSHLQNLPPSEIKAAPPLPRQTPSPRLRVAAEVPHEPKRVHPLLALLHLGAGAGVVGVWRMAFGALVFGVWRGMS